MTGKEYYWRPGRCRKYFPFNKPHYGDNLMDIFDNVFELQVSSHWLLSPGNLQLQMCLYMKFLEVRLKSDRHRGSCCYHPCWDAGLRPLSWSPNNVAAAGAGVCAWPKGAVKTGRGEMHWAAWQGPKGPWLAVGVGDPVPQDTVDLPSSVRWETWRKSLSPIHILPWLCPERSAT